MNTNNKINAKTITNTKHEPASSISLKISFNGELRRLPLLPFSGFSGLSALKDRLETLFDVHFFLIL